MDQLKSLRYQPYENTQGRDKDMAVLVRCIDKFTKPTDGTSENSLYFSLELKRLLERKQGQIYHECALKATIRLVRPEPFPLYDVFILANTFAFQSRGQAAADCLVFSIRTVAKLILDKKPIPQQIADEFHVFVGTFLAVLNKIIPYPETPSCEDLHYTLMTIQGLSSLPGPKQNRVDDLLHQPVYRTLQWLDAACLCTTRSGPSNVHKYVHIACFQSVYSADDLIIGPLASDVVRHVIKILQLVNQDGFVRIPVAWAREFHASILRFHTQFKELRRAIAEAAFNMRFK